MSIWTHVTGTLEIDKICFRSEMDTIKGVIENGLPKGSEQKLEYHIVECKDCTLLVFNGDLRDFELTRLHTITTWWHNLTNNLETHQGVLYVKCEDNLSPIILTHSAYY